ncbi:MAG: TetR/AcrR family transcriptional regulator [Lachnospiraceae bacterium]|nr:TetR/AcrR family transcriptional regulator [Lachnospiraceae bacterium]
MNEKFFDLKKEKQDRIISAAMKHFALNGFLHASTDDIVKDAGISKGLLFHYFGSKVGLYGFLYDYSMRFMTIELSSYTNKEETDYFEIIKQILTSRVDAMRQFPYVQLFLERAEEEEVPEAIAAVHEKRMSLEEQVGTILEQADITRFKAGADYVITGHILDYSLRGLMLEHIKTGAFSPERYGAEAVRYIDMLKRLSYN